MELIHKTALITECMTFTGKAIARGLATQGIDLVLCSSDEQGIENFNNEIYQINEEISVFIQKVNFSDTEEVLTFVEKIKSFFPVVDILVLNTEITQNDYLENIAVEEWDNRINSKLKSSFLLLKTFLPMMMTKQSGHIVSVTSKVNQSTLESYSLSTAIHFGLRGLLLSMKEEVRKDNIRVSLINICHNDFEEMALQEKLASVVLHVLINDQTATIDEINLS